MEIPECILKFSNSSLRMLQQENINIEVLWVIKFKKEVLVTVVDGNATSVLSKYELFIQLWNGVDQ